MPGDRMYRIASKVFNSNSPMLSQLPVAGTDGELLTCVKGLKRQLP